ncbi:hypothetical protein HF072_07515 [Bacillus sp. RO3]|nr:hypothetical protein [Bacillus sp. RO3]
MAFFLKVSGYITLICSVLIAFYVLSIDYLDYKFIYAILIIIGSLPISLGAVLISRIYETLVEEKYSTDEDKINYVKNRNSQRSMY